MAGKKLENAIPADMYVNIPITEQALLKKKDNFTSTGMDRAGRDAFDADIDAEWKRNLGDVKTKLQGKYASGGAVKKGELYLTPGGGPKQSN